LKYSNIQGIYGDFSHPIGPMGDISFIRIARMKNCSVELGENEDFNIYASSETHGRSHRPWVSDDDIYEKAVVTSTTKSIV
jgi:hypothetical protein